MSLQSSLRQRILGTRTASIKYTNVQTGNAIQGTFYQFIPTGGNYVGNYPPGYMIENTAEVQVNIANYFPLQAVFKDEGKTIKAVIGDLTTVPTSTKGAGHFRQYQAIIPGVPSSTFGVVGGPPAGGLVVPKYYTVYVPIVMNGAVVEQGLGPAAPVFDAVTFIADGLL